MSLNATKHNLIDLLNDDENKVISLSGKWGTGKSHLWREVKSNSEDEAVKNALYVSLFGLIDMNQIKIKIIQGLIPNSEKNSGITRLIESTRKILTQLHKGFSALDEVMLLAMPNLLKNKVIVLDDIERKHDKLSIDEILGFIDEFTQQHESRFILILNSDQLDNRKVWDTLREKVVDQEVRLSTSTSESFDIAIKTVDSNYKNSIRIATEQCGITNIRIIRKIIKVVNRILGNRTDLSDELLSRVVPSTVLLSAIHYKGIENGPDFKFILKHGSISDIAAQFSDKEVDQDKEKLKAESNWKLLLDSLGIYGCDEYELLVVDFLESGLFDSSKITKIINKYTEEIESINAASSLRNLFEQLIWNHRLTDSELLNKVKEFIPKLHFINAYNFTSLHSEVSKLADDNDTAAIMLDKWILEFKNKNHEDFNSDNLFGDKIHPAIQAEFDAIKAQSQASITIIEACEVIATQNGWSTRHELAMEAATTTDFATTIKTIDIKKLQWFMPTMLNMVQQPTAYQKHFGNAMNHFTEACKEIAQDPNSARLGKLIKKLFANSNLGHLL